MAVRWSLGGSACALALVAVSGQNLPTPLPRSSEIPLLDPLAGSPAPARRVPGEIDPARLPPAVEVLSANRIWDQAPHNAFTDLIRFQDRWYCSFREGSKHVSPDGAVRVITSTDGVGWTTAFRVNSDYADLRDPKLSLTPDNRLMLSAQAAYNPPTEIGHQTLAWYSLDGREWGEPFRIGDPEFWLWRVTWYRGNAYSMAYSTSKDRHLRMYVGPGGLRFQMVTDRILDQGAPSEATLLFNRDDSALCLLRRDGDGASALLGFSRPPYRGWEWRDLGLRLGGPDMIRLPDGRLLAAGRVYAPEPRTAILWVHETEPAAEVIVTLPSGGDTSYPGLVWHKQTLWVSYYSSHEDKTAIYLAKVRIPARPEDE